MRFDLPPKRHWRMLSGYCDTGKMAFENLPLGVSSNVYTACTLNAARCAGGVAVDDKRIRLEVVRLLMHVTRRSIQSLASHQIRLPLSTFLLAVLTRQSYRPSVCSVSMSA